GFSSSTEAGTRSGKGPIRPPRTAGPWPPRRLAKVISPWRGIGKARTATATAGSASSTPPASSSRSTPTLSRASGSAGLLVRRAVDQRGDDGAAEERNHHPERPADRNLVPGAAHHLDPDEGEDQTQPDGKVVEAIHHSGEEEEQGAQAEDGEDVRGEDDEGI